MNFALTTVKEALVSLSSAAVDSGLKDDIKRMANHRKVVPHLKDVPFVHGPLMRVLEGSYNRLSTGMTHVLFAEPSSGKTSACRVYTEMVMKEYDAPALMVTGQAPNQDYFAHVARQLGVKKEGPGWIASLLAALQPEPGSKRAHATLILDEFNHRGPDDMNLQIAEAICREIYNNSFGFTLILVTQNEDVANALCRVNKWQKIGPLPDLSTPNRWAVKNLKNLPENVTWIPMVWTTRQLTVLILHRFPGKFDNEMEGDILPWLVDVLRPTLAIELATQRHSGRCGAMIYSSLPL